VGAIAGLLVRGRAVFQLDSWGLGPYAVCAVAAVDNDARPDAGAIQCGLTRDEENWCGGPWPWYTVVLLERLHVIQERLESFSSAAVV
jgi:hypothetical protein